jgi:hypothetical protein
MEVTITIPDEFAERLIPAGEDASRVLLERLVDEARDGGRIDVEEANAILCRAVKAESDGIPPESRDADALLESYDYGEVPEWIDDPEQVRLHAAGAKFIGCISSPTLTRSTDVSKAIRDSLMEQYERSQHGR